jgi:hypothetical protein
MSVTYIIDQKKHATYIVGKGLVAPTELVSTVERLAADPNFVPTMRLLADFSEADLGQLQSCHLEAVALVSPFGQGPRCAVVRAGAAAHASQEFAFFMKVHDRNTHKFFASRPEALAFLNADLPEPLHMN